MRVKRSRSLYPTTKTARRSLHATPDNGIEMLKKLKSNDIYQEIPVVILSDNNFSHYRSKCYQLGAASFIKKPETHQATQQKIETFFKYWFEVAEV